MQAGRLIPRLPNEITDMVVRELPLLDIVCCMTLSRVWKTFIETDNETSKTMFRLPVAVRTNPDLAMRKLAVEELWELPYAKRNEGGCLWDTVKLHPFLRIREDLDEEHRYSEGCCIDLESTVLLSDWVAKLEDSDSQASWRSMLLTYPPVTRTYIHIRHIRWNKPKVYLSMGLPVDYDRVNLEGVTLGDIFSAIVDRPGSRDYCASSIMNASACLWPRWSLWETRAGGPVSVDDNLVDGDDVVMSLVH